MNRLDKVVVFKTLRPEQLEQVLELELAKVQQRIIRATRTLLGLVPLAVLRIASNFCSGAVQRSAEPRDSSSCFATPQRALRSSNFPSSLVS
jgi:Zn-dependent protease with chaperone function